MTWEPGRDQIRGALSTGELQQVTGGKAAGEGWLVAARTKLATAALIADADPESAYVTAYDAARFALVEAPQLFCRLVPVRHHLEKLALIADLLQPTTRVRPKPEDVACLGIAAFADARSSAK